MTRTAVVAGATGLTGRRLVEQLRADARWTRVTALLRGPDRPAPAGLDTRLFDFSHPAGSPELLAVDDLFCCLGTTLAKAGSREAFAAVDETMVVELAGAARNAGCRQLIVVSALGASRWSPSFYSRVKARMEAQVSALGFDAVHIMQPSLLLGDRSERRVAERAAQRIAPYVGALMVGPLAQARPVAVDELAAAMIAVAASGLRGVHRHRLPLTRSGG
jgi:uncharacterized protein YbjT (DUF2867 family)